MDVGHIIVGVLTTAAASWLVWAEIHSRRNQVRQRVPEPVDPGIQNLSETQRKAAGDKRNGRIRTWLQPDRAERKTLLPIH